MAPIIRPQHERMKEALSFYKESKIEQDQLITLDITMDYKQTRPYLNDISGAIPVKVLIDRYRVDQNNPKEDALRAKIIPLEANCLFMNLRGTIHTQIVTKDGSKVSQEIEDYVHELAKFYTEILTLDLKYYIDATNHCPF